MSDEERSNVVELKLGNRRPMDEVDVDDQVAEIIDIVNMLNFHERRFKDILSKMQAENQRLVTALHDKDLVIKQKDSEIVELKREIDLLQDK